MAIWTIAGSEVARQTWGEGGLMRKNVNSCQSLKVIHCFSKLSKDDEMFCKKRH